MRPLIIATLLVFGVLTPAPGWAYIDPGTGASFVGALGPLIAGLFAAAAAFGMRYFWNPIRGLFSRGKKDSNEQK